MKEGYAIFYALRKWDYLLRDRKLTILTDHENLTRLRVDNDANKMVKRWFMCFQEYDIQWEYIRGEDNIVPDALSRLCAPVATEHVATLLYQLTGYEIPEHEWDMIASAHGSHVGHGGVERTLRRLDDLNLQWKERTAHVRRFIKMCPCCQKMDQLKRVIHSYPFTTSSYGLWDVVSVDHIESLVPDQYGMSMIIVIVDNFSRFVDLYATKSTDAEAAADALLSFCGRYGTPMQFTTDSGTAFHNNLMRGLTTRLGVNHHLTSAYSKEQNAIVERTNKETLRHLRDIIFDQRVANRWSKYLPIVQRIINSSVNSSTGLTPAQLVFPNGITLDRDLLSRDSEHDVFLSAYVKDLMQSQAIIFALAEHNLREKDDKHLEEYSKERTVFKDGEYVLAEHRHQALRRGPKSKLLPFLKGPLRVMRHNPENGMYWLQNLVTQVVSEYHVSRLRPFLYDERTLTPLQVATADTLDEFIVEKVLTMEGDPHKPRKFLRFRIRWAGYGPEDDTW